MKIVNPVVFALSIVLAGGTPAWGQDASAQGASSQDTASQNTSSQDTSAQDPSSMPKVLQISREFTKPYKNGMIHDKSESAFVAAMTKAKFPAYYVAMSSLSGKSRSLYVTRYSSFAEWETDNKLVEKNAALAAEIERASLADGDLLEAVDSGVFVLDEDLSYKPRADISHAHYMEITEFHVKLGQRENWLKLASLVKDGHEKAGDSAHWGMYEVAYGAPDGTYLAFSSDNSMADIDTGFADDKKFHEALGEDGMKELRELYGETVESSTSELFQINPKQSYVPEDWVKADPDFWRPKPAMASAAPAKPATKQMASEKKP